MTKQMQNRQQAHSWQAEAAPQLWNSQRRNFHQPLLQILGLKARKFQRILKVERQVWILIMKICFPKHYQLPQVPQPQKIISVATSDRK